MYREAGGIRTISPPMSSSLIAISVFVELVRQSEVLLGGQERRGGHVSILTRHPSSSLPRPCRRRLGQLEEGGDRAGEAGKQRVFDFLISFQFADGIGCVNHDGASVGEDDPDGS